MLPFQGLNPGRWTANAKSLASLLALMGSIWGAADFIGTKIYRFAEIQTATLEQLKTVQIQLLEEKTSIAESNILRERSLGSLELKIVPRVDKLEGAINEAKLEAAAAKQRVDDIKETLGEIKGLARQGLEAAKSHDDDISATRNAVAPRGLTNPR